MAIQCHEFWGEWKDDKGLNNNISLGAKAVTSERPENRRLTPPLQGISRVANIRINLTLPLPECRIIRLHLRP